MEPERGHFREALGHVPTSRRTWEGTFRASPRHVPPFAEPKGDIPRALSEVVLQMLFSVRIFVFWRNSELAAPWPLAPRCLPPSLSLSLSISHSLLALRRLCFEKALLSREYKHLWTWLANLPSLIFFLPRAHLHKTWKVSRTTAVQLFLFEGATGVLDLLPWH